MLVSHEAHSQLYCLLTSASTLLSFRPFSPGRYTLDVTLQTRETGASLEMRSGQPASEVPSLFSFKGRFCLKLCYNPLYAHPLTHLEAATADMQISCLQKAPEILAGFLKIFLLPNQSASSTPSSPSLFLRQVTGWRYFPPSLSLLSEDCTASYLVFSGQAVRCSWQHLLLELYSRPGLLRNVSSSRRHRSDRRGTGLRFLARLSGAQVETASMERILSLSSLLTEVELHPPERGGDVKRGTTAVSVRRLARKLKGLVWRKGSRIQEPPNPPDSLSRPDLTANLELQSLYLVLDPVLLANFFPLALPSSRLGAGGRLCELVCSELSQFSSRQISLCAEDAVLALYHSDPLIRSKQPLFKLVLAHCASSLLLPTPPGDESPLGTLTLSARNLYLHSPGVASSADDKAELSPLSAKPDSLEVSPDSGVHLWGRCLECTSLSSKLSIPADAGSPFSVCLAAELVNAELSRHGLFALEWLLSAFMPLPDTSNRTASIAHSLTLPEISLSASLRNINLFLYDLSPNAPALLLHTDSLSSQLSAASLVLTAESTGLLPIQVEEGRFAVSTLANLPQGLLELESLSAVLSRRQQPQLLELGSEAASLHWTPTRHCHLADCAKAVKTQVLEFSRFLSARYSVATGNSHNSLFSVDSEPKLRKEGVEYRSFLGQIRSGIDVSCGCKQLYVSIRPDPNTSVSFDMRESFACLKSGQLSMSVPALKISMDKREVISLSQILLIRMNSPPPELSQARSLFSDCEWPTNFPVAISFQKLSVSFPYKYNVALTVHKLTNILKFLRRTHFPADPDSRRLVVPPDLVLSAGEILIDLPDDSFEVKMRDQYELKSDESLEKAHRRQLMDEKIREIRSQEGELVTSDKIEGLQGSLRREDSTVYINRARTFYRNNPMRHWLLRIRLSQSSLSILADPSLQGRGNLARRLKEINPESPLPEALDFSVLWGRNTQGCVGKCELLLRDYPQPLTSIHALEFSGTVLGVERRGGPLSVREACVDIFPPWDPFKLNLNICPLKFFHDLTAKASKIDFAWGAAFEPAWMQVGEVAEMLYLPSLDPSPALPFWDRIRIKRHGRFRLSCDKFTVFLLSSRDPYNNTESLVVEMKRFSALWANCRLRFEGEVGFFLSTASKYDDCRLAYLPRAELDIQMIWVTDGNNMDHHHICPVNRAKATAPVPDSYALFRSSCLDLSIHLNIQGCEREEKQLTPKFLCYASAIRWLKNFKNSFLLNVTRPTRRGSVWLNVRPPKKKLSRHYRTLRFSSQLCACQLSYWSSYAHRQGVTVHVAALEMDSEYRLAVKAVADGLIHRPTARFKVAQCQIGSSDIRIDACSCNLSDAMKMKRMEFVSVCSISYRYNVDVEKTGEDAHSPTGDNAFKHHVEANKVRILWNCFVRTLVLGLYESYENSRILRKNQSSEVLRNISVLKKSLQQAAMAEHTPVNHVPPLSTSHKPSRKTLELDRFLELRDKSHSHEDLARSGQQEERVICENRWLVELMEIQVALCCERELQGQGESAEGWLLVTSAHSFVTGMLNEPRWNKGDLLQKKVWEARVNLMQYFASHAFSQAGQVPWLDSTLVLGEQRQTESIFNELVPPEQGLAREQQEFSMGAVYASEAGTDLQRIAYSSYCSVSYACFLDLECDNPADLEMYSSKESLSSTSSFNSDTANTFYLRHPELKVATSSLQYSIVLDIVNNLLLYFESEKKKVAQRYEQLRFELQLNNSGKELDLLLTESQNRVRELASRVRRTEKSLYAAEHGQSDRRPLSGDWVSILSVSSGTRCTDLQAQLSQAKEELGSASLDLKLLIKYIKEVEFQRSSSECAEESSVPTTREIDIWLEEVKWVLLQDGQLAIAQIDLGQAFYCVSTNQDGSGEHRFELGSLSVMNLLPNTPFPHALSTYDPGLANPKIDRNSSLRIFLKERAPVGGIYVKEHLEVNLVPLAIRLTKRFYKTIFAYFFQQTGSGKNPEFAEGFTASSDGTSLDLISLGGESVSSELSENLERMKERAEKNKSFIYIKIPDVPISLSYKGNKEKNIEDVRDLECVFGPLEYHNQIYTWKELFVRLKKEIKRLVISQAFKRKIGLKTGIDGPLLPGASLNLDTEKAKLIGVRKSPPQNPKRKKKAKKLGSRDSDLSASIPTDESDQSDFTSSLPESFSIPYNHKPL